VVGTPVLPWRFGVRASSLEQLNQGQGFLAQQRGLARDRRFGTAGQTWQTPIERFDQGPKIGDRLNALSVIGHGRALQRRTFTALNDEPSGLMSSTPEQINVFV